MRTQDPQIRQAAGEPVSSSIIASMFTVFSQPVQSIVAIWDVVKEQDFILRYASPPFLCLLGKTQEEALGKKLEDTSRPPVREIIRRFRQCTRDQRDIDFIHNVHRRFYYTRISAQTEAGQIVCLITISIEITKYLEERNRLKESNRQHRQQCQLLQTQLNFETLISQTLRDLMDSGSAGFDGCLSGLTRNLGMLMEADEALILQKRGESMYIHKARWTRDDSQLNACSRHIRNIQNNHSSLSQINRTLAVNDTHRDHGMPYLKELRELGVRALLCVPICRDTHMYGLLCLTHTGKPHIWTTAEISMAKTAADTIMCAYLRLHVEKSLNENIRILTEYDESLQDLLAQKETLAEVSQRFLRADARNFSESARVALEDIGHLLDADGIRILLRAPGEPQIFEWQEKCLPCRIGREYGRLNAAILCTAEAMRSPLAIDNTADACPHLELAQAAAGEGLRCLLVLPISCSGEVIGAMACFKAIGFKHWHRMDIISAEAFIEVFMDAYRLRQAGAEESALALPRPG